MDNSQALSLQLTQAHLDAMAQNISGSITLFGFLTIAWDADLSVPQVSITVTLNTPFGNKTIGAVVLNAQNPSITLGGSVGPFTAQVTLSFDVSSMVLNYDAELKVPFKTYQKSGSIQL